MANPTKIYRIPGLKSEARLSNIYRTIYGIPGLKQRQEHPKSRMPRLIDSKRRQIQPTIQDSIRRQIQPPIQDSLRRQIQPTIQDSLQRQIQPKCNIQNSSVADPECLSRIPDPDFCPSRIPDLGSRIQKQRQKRGVKKKLMSYLSM